MYYIYILYIYIYIKRVVRYLNKYRILVTQCPF